MESVEVRVEEEFDGDAECDEEEVVDEDEEEEEDERDDCESSGMLTCSIFSYSTIMDFLKCFKLLLSLGLLTDSSEVLAWLESI